VSTARARSLLVIVIDGDLQANDTDAAPESRLDIVLGCPAQGNLTSAES
jgi:hypothetical protein